MPTAWRFGHPPTEAGGYRICNWHRHGRRTHLAGQLVHRRLPAHWRVRLVRVGGRNAHRGLALRRQPPLALQGDLGRRRRGLERRLRRTGCRQLRVNHDTGELYPDLIDKGRWPRQRSRWSWLNTQLAEHSPHQRSKLPPIHVIAEREPVPTPVAVSFKLTDGTVCRRTHLRWSGGRRPWHRLDGLQILGRQMPIRRLLRFLQWPTPYSGSRRGSPSSWLPRISSTATAHELSLSLNLGRCCCNP